MAMVRVFIFALACTIAFTTPVNVRADINHRISRTKKELNNVLVELQSYASNPDLTEGQRETWIKEGQLKVIELVKQLKYQRNSRTKMLVRKMEKLDKFDSKSEALKKEYQDIQARADDCFKRSATTVSAECMALSNQEDAISADLLKSIEKSDKKLATVNKLAGGIVADEGVGSLEEKIDRTHLSIQQKETLSQKIEVVTVEKGTGIVTKQKLNEVKLKNKPIINESQQQSSSSSSMGAVASVTNPVVVNETPAVIEAQDRQNTASDVEKMKLKECWETDNSQAGIEINLPPFPVGAYNIEGKQLEAFEKRIQAIKDELSTKKDKSGNQIARIGRIEIIASASAIGSKAGNEALSNKRADAAADLIDASLALDSGNFIENMLEKDIKREIKTFVQSEPSWDSKSIALKNNKVDYNNLTPEQDAFIKELFESPGPIKSYDDLKGWCDNEYKLFYYTHQYAKAKIYYSVFNSELAECVAASQQQAPPQADETKKELKTTPTPNYNIKNGAGGPLNSNDLQEQY